LTWANPVADATMSSNAIFAKRILMSPCLVECQPDRPGRGPSANEHFIANRAA